MNNLDGKPSYYLRRKAKMLADLEARYRNKPAETPPWLNKALMKANLKRMKGVTDISGVNGAHPGLSVCYDAVVSWS